MRTSCTETGVRSFAALASSTDVVPSSGTSTYATAEVLYAAKVTVAGQYTLGDTKMPTFQVRFDYNDKYIAAAMADGSIKIFNVFTTKPSYILNEDLEEKMPTLAIR